MLGGYKLHSIIAKLFVINFFEQFSTTFAVGHKAAVVS
jgi:hypothetical protein